MRKQQNEVHMQEERKSGGKQFMLVLLTAAILYILCGVIMSAFGSYAFVGGIISVIIFGVYGYFILIHYTARFTYSVKGGRLRINRMIGKRNKELEFACKDITRMCYGTKPVGFNKPIHSMRISIISAKESLYIEYKNKENNLLTVVIEPSDGFRRRIERERNKIDG